MKCGLSLAFAALWLMVSQAPADAQDFDKGLAAARAGDFAAALAEWRPLAENGHAEAQFNLGAVYEAGLGVLENPENAAGWYALAAGQGHAKAQYNLGVMFADGRGVARDDTRAAIWLRKAAEQDHGKAQYNLGILYQTGRGLPKDPVQAQAWFDRAAANGVAPARANRQDPAPVADTGSLDLAPETDDANSPGQNASAPVEPDLLDDGEKPLEPEDFPLAVKSVGLNLNESGLSAPSEQAVTAGTELEPMLEPDSEPEPGLVSDLPPEPEPAASANIASLPPKLPVEPPTESLLIAASFPAGARYRLLVTETRERSRDGGFVMAQTSEMGVDMVVKSDPGPGGGALIQWTFGPATVETAGDPRAGRLASELGKLIDGQIVEYRINRNGEVTGLVNPGQISKFYEKSIERVLTSIDVQAANPQLADKIRANLAPLLSDDYAATRALDLPRLLHFFSGLELTAGKTYSRDSVMSLPPSADALPSTLNYELKWFDRAAGVAWLSWRQSVDPQRAAGAMRAYIETLAAQSDRSTPAQYDIGAVGISDSADYEIDLATGFPRQVIYTRRVELFGFSQTEKRRIRVLR